MTTDEVAELREIFSLVDKVSCDPTWHSTRWHHTGHPLKPPPPPTPNPHQDGGGTISKGELAELMATLGVRATSDELDIMIREVDVDGSGEIDFGEFVSVMQRRVEVPYTAAEVKAAFKVFEGSCPPGYVRAPDLIAALNLYGGALGGDKLAADKVAELVAQMEPDINGVVSYAEVVSMMLDT